MDVQVMADCSTPVQLLTAVACRRGVQYRTGTSNGPKAGSRMKHQTEEDTVMYGHRSIWQTV